MAFKEPPSPGYTTAVSRVDMTCEIGVRARTLCQSSHDLLIRACATGSTRAGEIERQSKQWENPSLMTSAHGVT